MKKLIFALLSSSLIANAIAQTTAIKEGTDYTIISKPAKSLPATPGKIAVAEFFSYACIHCSLLEPSLDQWLSSAKNVAFTRIQVVWENNFQGFAKLNATAQSLNLKSNFSQQVFNAVMQQHQNLEDPKELQKFLEANKKIVDPAKFMAAYNSFTISTKPQEYSQYTSAYNITGTPTFVVANMQAIMAVNINVLFILYLLFYSLVIIYIYWLLL